MRTDSKASRSALTSVRMDAVVLQQCDGMRARHGNDISSGMIVALNPRNRSSMCDFRSENDIADDGVADDAELMIVALNLQVGTVPSVPSATANPKHSTTRAQMPLTRIMITFTE